MRTSALRAKLFVSQAFSPLAALDYFASPGPAAVLVTDPGITNRHNTKVLTALVSFARGGGHVAIGCQFNSFVTGAVFKRFSKEWGSPWCQGNYHRTAQSLHPNAGQRLKVKEVTTSRNRTPRRQYISGADPEHFIYRLEKSSHLQSLFAPAPITNLDRDRLLGLSRRRERRDGVNRCRLFHDGFTLSRCTFSQIA
jgi:hypothetical protein